MVTVLKQLTARVRGFLKVRDLDRDLDQELESHLTMLTEDNIHRGMGPEEAHRAAVIRVGHLASLKERHRDIRGLPTIDGVLQDLRLAGRRLVKDRWFSAAVIMALALGIGANSAVFTIVNAILLRSLPIDHPDRIMTLESRDPRGRPLGISLEDFADWRAASHTFSGMTLVNYNTQTISADDRVPERYAGVFISANGLSLIGAKPALGRAFVEEEDRPGAPPVILLSDGVWKSRYGGDPAVLGKSVTVQGLSVTIIGVMPPDFNFPPTKTELWSPLGQLPPDFWTRGRQARNYFAYGRLADSVTPEQARSELSNISAQLAQQYPATNKDLSAAVTPFANGIIPTPLRITFWSLMGAVAFVLLIACANVANLMLARAAHRTREVAVRVSLGATRWRVVRQLLVESLLLAFMSGVAGLGLATALIRWFDSETRNVGMPYWIVFSMDVRVFAFVAAVCLLTGIAFGLAPALLISKTNVNDVIKEGGRSGAGGVRTRRWTGALMVTELTLTLVLLAGAGFMMRSFVNMYRIDVGVDTSRLLTTSMVLPGRKYPTRQSAAALLRRIDERLDANGTFAAASTTTGVPLAGGAVRQLVVDGRSAGAGDTPANVTLVSAGPRYFDALDVRLVRGRAFELNDGGPGHEVAIINERTAALYFGTTEPIGTRVRLTDDTPAGRAAPWATIVGIVPNIRQRSFGDPNPDPVVYIPHVQSPVVGLGAFGGLVRVVARGRSDPGQLAKVLRSEIAAIDSDMVLADIRTLDQELAQQRWLVRVFTTMFSVFAGIAIVLAAIGLFAVTAYSVTQRTQEIGLRMALGARTGQVAWLILRRGFLQLVIGLTFGLAGAFGVGRLLKSLLFQTGPTDPVTLISVTVLLMIVGISASLWPAWQATRLDPVTALRYE